MVQSNSIEVIDHFQISPPQGAVPATASIPLSFLDMLWLLCRPMQRLFFYDFPHPIPYLMQNILPSLTTSLSLTLQHFYPFAGNLAYPPPPLKPHIVFTNSDSIPFTVAQTTTVDFNEIIRDHVRDVRELHPLVPKLPPSRSTQDGTRMLPLLAVQLTLFPNLGLCIGFAFQHVAGDGVAFNHFVKFWAFVFRSSELTHVEKWLPCLDRGILKDPREVESHFLKACWEGAPPGDHNIDATQDDSSLADKVRATFRISKENIEKLKRQVSDHTLGQLHASTFTVTSAIIWVALIKTEGYEAGVLPDVDKPCYFDFPVDCRERLEKKVPNNYFGNCVGVCFVPARRGELLGDNGIVVAAKTIGEKIKEFIEGGVLRDAETWLTTWKEMHAEGKSLFSVASSPRLRVYETDFGWGRPKKSEVVHVDSTEAVSISDCRDGGGGVEIGLALTRSKMDVFTVVFEQHLKQM
uniref:Coumaroyl-CoA:anthocyanidin 3-O-glucoside-6''-O-coumaroyltransferase 1-like n=1 Tax=Rhizophora mucronata TaxID=61149 RepID=A0A2P2J2K2_RHIMU